MTTLTTKDVQAFNAAVLELHATQTMEEFSEHIGDAMRGVMTGEVCAVNWIDRRTTIALSTIYHPAAPIAEEINSLAQTLLATQAPFWLNCADEPQAASHHMTRTEWRKRDIHWACRQVDKEEFICFDVHLTSTLMLSLAEMRSRYGMYSPRRAAQAQAPRPPTSSRSITASPPRLALPSVATGTSALPRLPLAWSPSNASGPPEARDLLADYGVVVFLDILPDLIRDWFVVQQLALEQPSETSKGVTPLHIQRGRQQLSLYLMRSPRTHAYRLVMQEKEAIDENDALFQGLGLSPRESEVLYWLAQGKSNPEIAIILSVSTGTVGRHLENIYPKLGLENRYAAGLMAAQLLAAKAQAAIPGKAPHRV